MQPNLKLYREEHLKLSVAEVAEKLDFLSTEINKMEKENQYSTEYYEEFDDYFNIDLNVMKSLLERNNNEKPKVRKKRKTNFDGTSWKQIDSLKNSLVDRLQQEDKHLEDLQQKAETTIIKNDITKLTLNLKEVLRGVHSILRKPTVAFVGTSDVGKSTMINKLLGTDKLPTDWTPTTSMNIVIKHIADQPKFIKDELTFFKGTNELFDINKLYDEKYVQQSKVESGEASMLGKFSTRQSGKSINATHAVLYLDCAVLQACDIVDLPGFGTGDSELEDKLAQQSYNFADIVVFLSRANGFMHSKDIEFLKASLLPLKPIENQKNKLPVLSNLFIVASQAKTVENGNIEKLENILDIGSSRLYNELPPEIWENRQKQTKMEITEVAFRQRFFYYAVDSGQLREPLEKGLNELLSVMPKVTLDSSKDVLKQTINMHKNVVEQEYKNVTNTQKNYDKMLKSYLKKKEAYRLNKNELLKGASHLQQVAQKYEIECLNQFETELEELISESNVIKVIDDKKYKKKKEDLERLMSYLTTQIQLKLQNILSEKAEAYKFHIDEFLEEYDSKVNPDLEIEIDNFSIPFNTKAVFAGALASLGTFGALSIWASSLGNLGAYILVVKGVSLLSAVGISVGGTAAATAGVAAIGGPVVLGIAIAGILGISIWKLFSGSWKKDIAKSVKKQFSSEDTKNKLTGEITKFWNMTSQELQEGIKKIEEEQQKELKQLEELLKQENQPLLESKADLFKSALVFYESLS